MSKEMEDGIRPDFTDNSQWFPIKILTDRMENNKKVMTQKSYISFFKRLLLQLQIVATHYGHWGRVSAPCELELSELLPEDIRILGKFVFYFNFKYI